MSITFMLNYIHPNLSDRNDIALTFWHSGSVLPTFSRLAFFFLESFFQGLIDRSRRTTRNTYFRCFRNFRPWGGSNHFPARTRWILYGDRVEPYPSDHRFWSPVRGCWRKWKKFPSAVYHSGIPMLKIYSMDMRYWFFISRLRWTFSRMLFSLLRPFLKLDKKCGYVNEKMRTPMWFVSVTCFLYGRTVALQFRHNDVPMEIVLVKTSNIVIFKRYNKINRKFMRKSLLSISIIAWRCALLELT